MFVSNTGAAGAMDPAAQALQMADMLEALVPSRPQPVQEELQQTHASMQNFMREVQETMRMLAILNASLKAELVTVNSRQQEAERVHQVAIEAQEQLITALQKRLDASDARTQSLTEQLASQSDDLRISKEQSEATNRRIAATEAAVNRANQAASIAVYCGSLRYPGSRHN